MINSNYNLPDNSLNYTKTKARLNCILIQIFDLLKDQKGIVCYVSYIDMNYIKNMKLFSSSLDVARNALYS